MKWNSRIVSDLGWPVAIDNRGEKEALARQMSGLLRDGEVIGVGAGSTVYLSLLAIAEKIHREKIHIRVIPGSAEMSMVCMRLGIPQTTLSESKPDWAFDGADEVDPAHNLLKGRGGALFKEKLLICSSPVTYILIDQSKKVSRLGEKFPVPVEVFPGAIALVEERLLHLGATQIQLRPAQGKDGPVYTENGNLILDVHFSMIEDRLEQQIKAIPGVIESGLFMGYPLFIKECRF